MADHYIPKITYTPTGGGPTTITFDYPAEKDVFGQELRHIGDVSIALSGNQQTSTDRIDEINTLKFKLVSQSIKDSLETFLTSHALLGKTFSYFFDKDDAGTEETVRLADNKFDFKTVSRKGSGFTWEFTLKIRRTL